VDDLRTCAGSSFSWFSMELLLRSSSRLGLLERFLELDEDGRSEIENPEKRALETFENGERSRSRIMVFDLINKRR